MEWLIKYCMKYKMVVLGLFTFITFFSLFCINESKIDAIPDLGENQQVIFTEWKGRSPKDIEEQVTYPLSILLQGIPGIDRVRGASAFGFSTIYVIFKEDVDFYWSRSRVLEKLSSASSVLPSGVTPTLGPDANGLGQIFWYTLENKDDATKPLSLQELRSLQDFFVRYQLQTVDGVSEVASVGGFVKEFQVDVDPTKILAYDVHFTKIINSLKNSNIDIGAEVIEEGDRELVIRGIGFLKNISDIEEVVVDIKEGTPIRVKDLASVQIGPAFRRGILDKNGKEVVGGIVTMRFGENPKDVISNIKNKLKSIKEGLPENVEFKAFYDRSELVDETMSTVSSALVQEIIITIIVVLIFLTHLKSSILVSLTLPLGIGISFILMYFLDISSNVMSLAGMVIAIGSMVDIGIIMTENIYNHLSEFSGNEISPDERKEVILKASAEIAPAIITAVLTTVITFIPVFVMTGAEGKLFTPLAWAKTLVMLGGVFVAIILIPVLAIFFFKEKLPSRDNHKLTKKIVAIYKPALGFVLGHRKGFLVIPTLFIILGGLSFSQLGREFMPSLNEGEILYMPVTTSDISITKARELLSYTDAEILKHPLVKEVVGKAGRADTALDPAPIAMFETLVKLVPKSEWPLGTSIYDIMADLDQRVQVPGLINSWDFPIQTRIGMISTGIKTQVGVKIFGHNIETLEKEALKVSKVLEKIEGAYGVYAERISGKPYIEFEIDRVAASRYGVNTGDINSILQTAVGGMAIGQVYEGRERYPIRVRYKKDFRDNIESLKSILIATPNGQHIPITQVAKIVIKEGPSMIQSENGLLRSTVLLNVRGRDLVGFVEEAKEAVRKEIQLSHGHTLEWAGQYENQRRANKRLMILIPISLLINLLIIYMSFRSWKLSLAVFSAVPMAASGGLILLWLFNLDTSVAVWVGFIALFGIAVDDGVVMMTYLKDSLAHNEIKNREDLRNVILEAGCRRIRPLIMTTCTTIFALLPVLWSTGQGSEVIRPMAVPTLGGMAVALISLFIVPVVFSFIYEKNIFPKGGN